jgi:stage V sporulation protein G
MIQQRVIVAYGEEVERSRLPGYVCTYDDYGEDNYARLGEDMDEGPIEPMILPVGDAIRRRDAAAMAQQPPHHIGAGMDGESNGRSLAWMKGSAASDEDNFGVGIV